MRRWIIVLCLLSLASLACATDDNLVRLIRAFERANWGYQELDVDIVSQFSDNYRDYRYPSASSVFLETDLLDSDTYDNDALSCDADVTYHQHAEGEQRYLDWSLNPSFSWVESETKRSSYDGSEVDFANSNESSSTSFGCYLQLDYRSYMIHDRYLAVDMAGSYYLRNRDYESGDDDYSRKNEQDYHRYSINPRVGIGNGRMRDVTNVVRAQRMSDRLMKISGTNLTDEQILTLAQYLDRQPAYQAMFDFDYTPDNKSTSSFDDNASDYHFWQDTLTQLGLENLTYDQFLYITQEARQNTLLKRQQGRLIEFGITGTWSNRTDEYTEYSDTQTIEQDAASFGLYGQYETARNLSTCQQIRFTLPVELLFERYEMTEKETDYGTLLEVVNKATVFSVSPEAEFLYQITDRLGLEYSAMWALSNFTPEEDNAPDPTLTNLRLGCDGAYFFSDSVRLVLSATYNKVNCYEDLMNFKHRAQEDWQIGFSITWKPLRSKL